MNSEVLIAVASHLIAFGYLLCLQNEQQSVLVHIVLLLVLTNR